MSAGVGRNEPCSCGSGKKYKKCCLDAGARTPAPSIAVADGAGPDNPVARAARLHALDRALVEQILELGMSFEGWEPEEAFPIELEDEPAAGMLFGPWAAYEHRDARGRSVADHFRSEAANELTHEEIAWLEAQSRARLGIWQIVDVTPGHSIRVRNSLTHVERTVIERSGSETLRVHESILVRIVDFAGLSLFCGMHPCALGPREAQHIVRSILEGLGGKRARRLDEKTLNQPDFAEMLIDLWERALDELASRPMPKLVTTDGEELVPIVETFSIVNSGDTARVRDALLSLPHATLEGAEDEGVEPDETRIAFVRDNAPGSQLENTVIGHATVSRARLVMETMSRERADRFRKQIERACGAWTAFVSREERDVEQMFAEREIRSSTARKPLRERAAPPPGGRRGDP